MSYKKFFSATALAMLLSVSNTAFSDSVDTIEEDDEETSFYVSLRGSIDWGNIGKLDVKGSGDKIGKLQSPIKALKDGEFIEYAPKYKPSFLNGGVAVGYRMGNMRFELEGFYSGLKIDDTDEPSKKIYSGDFTGMPGLQQAVEDAQKALADDTKGNKADKNQTLKDAENALHNALSVLKDIENKGFSTTAAMFNGYYDIALGEDVPVGIYVGVGLGGAKVKFLESTDEGFMDNMKFAMQFRLGTSYPLSPACKLFGGGRYLHVFSDEFNNIKYSNGKQQAQGSNTDGDSIKKAANVAKNSLNLKNKYGVFSVEAGVMFNF